MILVLILFGSTLIWLGIGRLTLFLVRLSLFYYPLIVDGYLIKVAGHELLFNLPCNANYAYLLLALLVLLTNIDFKKSIKLFLIGSLFILTANVLRLNILIYVLINYGITLFNTLHLFFWKVLSTIYVILVWIFLVYKFKIKEIPVYSYLKLFKKEDL